jgi:hypothetical protein
MSLESLMAASLRLSSAVETLAVLGAELSLRQAPGLANLPIR